MLPIIISLILILSPRKLVLVFIILGCLVSSCTSEPHSSPGVGTIEPAQTAVADAFILTPQVLVITPTQPSVNDTDELFSSDRLGLCFSYPQGYIQIPYNDAVEILGPDLPGSEPKVFFWLDISDPYNQTVEEIADKDMTFETGVDVDRWTVTLGGEQAVVLDGMPGQDLQRRVYVVYQQTLYVLSFSPTRLENTAENDQMEVLYTAVMSSWAWSPCSVSE